MWWRSSSLRHRVAIGGVVVVLLGAGAARAADPIYLPWPSLLPSLATPFDPTSSAPCRNGSIRCVQQTIQQMQRSFDRLAPACSHGAIFSLVYLRVTQKYEETVSSDPAFFANTPFVNHEDVIFAGYYFRAYDDWYGGHHERVP